jgi:hypothetical protein
MSSVIKLKNSSIPGRIPTIDQLDLGELAVNTYDAKIYLKQNQDDLEQVVEFVTTVPVKNKVFVQKNGNDNNDGSTLSSAVLTIEKAIQIAKKRNELTVIDVAPGVYTSKGHIDMPDNTLIVATHRSAIIRPKPGFEERNVFRMGSGCFIEGLIFDGWRLDSLENPSEGFAVCFRPGANIRRTPYAHKITVRTTPFWTTIAPPLDRDNANPLIGRGAGVALADGSVLNPNSIYPNIMTWGATPVTHNGIGYVAKNGGLINAVNAISVWGHKHFLAIDGGSLVLSSCTTQFGDFSMVSQGVREIVRPYEPSETLVKKEDDANIILANKDTIVNDTWTYLTDTLGYQGYDSSVCKRDIGLILDGVAKDLVLGTNYWGIVNGISYRRASASLVQQDQLTQTIGSIEFLRDKIIALLTHSASITRVQTTFNNIINVALNGDSAADPLAWSSTGIDDHRFARLQLQNNKQLIEDELIEWITQTLPSSFVYDEAVCRRDTGYIVDAFSHDLNYDANNATVLNARAYFSGTASQLPQDQIVPTALAIRQLGIICSQIVRGVYPDQDLSDPVATQEQGDKCIMLADIIRKVLLEGSLISLPLETHIDDDWVDIDFILSAKIIDDNAKKLRDDTIAFINLEYKFLDEAFTKRDTESILQSLYWTLLSANGRPFDDLIKGFFDVRGKRVFKESLFDYEKSLRDSLLITEAIKYDVLFGSNFRTITAAKSFFRNSASNLLDQFKDEVIYSLQQQKILTGNFLSGFALDRSDTLFDEIINIISLGESQASSIVLSDPVGYDSGFFHARRLLLNNKEFIQDEIDAWIADQVSSGIEPFDFSFTYNEAACRRDVGLIVDALSYDLTYGGNLETYNAAVSYFIGTQAQYGNGEKLPTIAAYQRLKSILGDILRAVAITPSPGNITPQDTSSPAGSESATAFAQNRIDDIIGTISSNGRPPVRLFPDTDWPDIEYQQAFGIITLQKRKISQGVMINLNKEYETLLGAFLFAYEFINQQVNALIDPSSITIVDSLFEALTTSVIDPLRLAEPSTITSIGHTWTGIMAGVALTKIPPVRNETTIQESILELDRGQVIASGQDDEGSALFVGGLEISADTGELGGPPFDTAVNRVATRAAIARSF